MPSKPFIYKVLSPEAYSSERQLIPQKRHSRHESPSTERYKAPALRKGLEILELLATVDTPLTTPQIARALGRTANELFRMLQVLESMKYIARTSANGGFVITQKLFRMGMEQPKIRDFAQVGYPIMRELSDSVGQSCHLAVVSVDEIVVIMRVISKGEIGLSIQIGYRRPLVASTSGSVFFAFQPLEVQK